MGTMANNSWYRVVWEGYNNNVRDLLSEAWHSRFHTDLTIVAENQVIKCHRMVLARNIRYFREMLSQDFIDDKPVIVAVLAPYELVNAIITFTYLGEVNVVKSNLQPLMKLADELGVNGLMNSSTMNPQQSHYTQASSSVLCAAEALQNLGKAPRVADHTSYKLQQGFAIDYHVVPKQPSSTHEVSNQPSTGEQPPTAQQDQVDFQSLRYKAAASRKSASRSPPPCSTPSDIKKRRLSQTTSVTSAASPEHRNPSPHTSGSSYHLTKQEDPDSEDSDRELQIDEGIDQPSPMEYCDEQMYVEETEPQDLRVEARQHLPHSSDAAVCTSSSPVQSHPTSESMYLPSSVAVFPSTAASDMYDSSSNTKTSHFLSSSLAEVTVHTVPKKRPNGIALSVLNSSSTNSSGNFVTLTHQLTNLHSRKNSVTPTSTSCKDGGLVQVNINNNETNGTNNSSTNGSSNGKTLGGGSGGKSNEKSYSFDQLTAAVEVVVKGQAQPVEAINQYSIPRRTFFRHLKNRRTELGIESKNRSKPSSRATSPSSGSPNSSSSSGGSATPNLSNNFHQHHHHIPASGTQLHAMLKSISTAHQKVPPPQSMNNNIVKQEPEDASSFTNEEESSSSTDEKDKVFALLKQSVQMNLKQATCSKSSDRN